MDDLKLGATGEFPDGKLTPDDEGQLRIAIGIQDGVVVIHFGTPTTWIGLSAEEAIAFGETIARRSRESLRK